MERKFYIINCKERGICHVRLVGNRPIKRQLRFSVNNQTTIGDRCIYRQRYSIESQRSITQIRYIFDGPVVDHK
jgi:hypothetical protein